MKASSKKLFKNDAFQCILVVVFILCINIFAIGTNKVSGKSMYPTLNDKVDNDIIVVEKVCTYKNDYKKGDVITFKPDSDPKEVYVKRIIGIEDDVIEIKNDKVFVNGVVQKESYLKPGMPTKSDMKIKVPKDKVFVLGDNRENSCDSREIGPIPIKNIKGHAIYRFNIWKFNGNRIK